MKVEEKEKERNTEKVQSVVGVGWVKLKEIIEYYPELEEEDIKQSLEYAAWTVSEKVLPVTL